MISIYINLGTVIIIINTTFGSSGGFGHAYPGNYPDENPVGTGSFVSGNNFYSPWGSVLSHGYNIEKTIANNSSSLDIEFYSNSLEGVSN